MGTEMFRVCIGRNGGKGRLGFPLRRYMILLQTITSSMQERARHFLLRGFEYVAFMFWKNLCSFISFR